MKKSIFAEIIIVFFVFLLFGLNVSSYATEIEENLYAVDVSSDYQAWENLTEAEQQNTIEPRKYNINSEYTVENNRFIEKPLRSSIVYSKLMISNYKKYDLRDNISVTVRDQQNTGQCWAFSINSAIESNIEKLTGNVSPLFSARYLEYITSSTFLDGTNTPSYNREVGSGGVPSVALGAYTSGRGPVLEEDFPFENNQNKINLSEIQGLETQKQIKDYIRFPSIVKEYNGNTTIYKDENGNTYSTEELNKIREKIKQHIIQYGAIVSETYGAGSNNSAKVYYNNNNISKATAYFCNNTSVNADHQITIIGWDDDYDVENFNSSHRPNSSGAYIVLNSWGENFGENGVYYISYEDYFIEKDLLGIVTTSDIEYDNIYQYDELGNNYLLKIPYDLYAANIYTRNDTTINESLSQISVASLVDIKCDIYVNPTDGELDSTKFIKVAENYNVENGYHTIDIGNPINLTGDKFAVIIKYLKNDDDFSYIPLEIPDDNYWKNATGGANRCFLSLNEETWTDINSFSNLLNQADICLKVFTVNNPVDEPDNPDNPIDEPDNPDNPVEEPDNPELIFKSTTYSIIDNHVYGISPNTTLQDFYDNIETNGKYYIYDENNEDKTQIVKTGVKLHVNENEYTLIVKGDLDGNGIITITDVVKAKLHSVYVMLLKDDFLRALDINLDGDVTITDVVILNLANVNIIKL